MLPELLICSIYAALARVECNGIPPWKEHVTVTIGSSAVIKAIEIASIVAVYVA